MPRKLRINFLLFSPSIGGGDRVVAIYAQYLKRRGHDVTVTALKRRPPPLGRRLKYFLRTGQDMKFGFETILFDNAGIDLNIVAEKDRIEDSDVPDGDILIATFWRTAEWALDLSPDKGAKAYFVQNYESDFPVAPKARVDATYSAPLHKIVICQWLESIMRDKFSQAPVANIANSVNTEQFFASPRSKKARPTVGFLYSVNPIKGVDVTISAIKKIAAEFPDLACVSFGSVKASRQLPLPANCQFHYNPDQDNIRNIYAQCDVWISGSRVEGFNLPPLEAMACRTPVVTTSAGAMPELIQNGVQGFVVPIDDPAALAEKTLAVLNLNDDEWRRMSDAAYKTATRYTWDDAGALFEKALYDIVRSEGRVSLDESNPQIA